jgi:regulator of cell morphogenesis and NO signaling
MLDIKDKTIAEIVSDDISKAAIFKKYNIDFCCGGGITIEKACEKAGLDTNKVINDLLNKTTQTGGANLNFKAWKADFLADYIENVHHNYIKDNLTIINQLSSKVASVHGEHAPETIEIDQLFTELSNELISHLEKEETILFPAIKEKSTNPNYTFDKEVIDILEDEHDHAGTIVKRIQLISNNFTPPDWACNTYKALYHMLDEFINDLYQHIHLENNILFHKIKE